MTRFMGIDKRWVLAKREVVSNRRECRVEWKRLGGYSNILEATKDLDEHAAWNDPNNRALLISPYDQRLFGPDKPFGEAPDWLRIEFGWK